MSAPVHRRIEALEARQPQTRRWVWRRNGETTEQAKQRAGFSPDDAVIVFSWASKPTSGAAA
jgi:hypothetical protein